MSLDVHLIENGEGVYWANITHNLNSMAEAANIYEALWRPEELGVCNAGQLILPLKRGLILLKAFPRKYEKYNSPNGWGLYKHFVPFVEQYLEACIQNPNATVEVSR